MTSIRIGKTLRLLILVVGAAIMITPFVYMVSTSFKPQAYVLTFPPEFIPKEPTVQNYVNAWTKQDFSRYTWNSTVVTIISTAASVFLSAMVAYSFARFRFVGRKVLFAIIMIGLMVPGMTLIVPQFVLAKNLRLLDSHAGLVLFYIATTMALNTFLLRSFFQGVPMELDEAMQVDGANVWTRFWHLALPLARPALATATIFTFLACWDEFAWALTIINDPQKRTLPIAIQLYQGQNATQWGLVFAASIIAVIPVIAVFLIFQRHFVQGLQTGALKG